MPLDRKTSPPDHGWTQVSELEGLRGSLHRPARSARPKARSRPHRSPQRRPEIKDAGEGSPLPGRSLSQRCALQRRHELHARHRDSAQPLGVDENKVGAGLGRAGELNSIRGSEVLPPLVLVRRRWLRSEVGRYVHSRRRTHEVVDEDVRVDEYVRAFFDLGGRHPPRIPGSSRRIRSA